jgi:hypothetical protein
MAVAALSDGRLVAGEVRGDLDGRRRIGLHAVLPVVIGLSAPLLALALIDPLAFRSAKVVLAAFLGTGFIILTGLFAISVFHPGQPVSLVVDRARRLVTLVVAGPLSSSAEAIPFEEIRALRFETRYDKDGYAMTVGELALRDGTSLLVPAGLTESDLLVLRTAIGLEGKARVG